MTAAATTKVGVLVVHGIGEQKRFEHLDGQVRQLLAALAARPATTVTPEIGSAPASAFRAHTDSWDGEVPVRVHVRETVPARSTVIEFHEVWWADVNEEYSLTKQLRFWGWALGIWLYPDKKGSVLAQAALGTAPATRGSLGLARELWIRAKLFGVGIVAVSGALSLGLLDFIAKRVFDLEGFKLVGTFVNYVAGVKLYNQKRRMGPGLPPEPDDFLDTVGDPPRVSVRRRMVRSLMAMAEQKYDRWYVLAHSLGSVIAFNGLMETAYTWPGYFDKATWDKARSREVGLAGPARGQQIPGRTMPPRPVWVEDQDVAYRSAIFHSLHGFLTFGSPLEKFAAVWPARVIVSHQPAFRAGTAWLNVFDPTDPVSGVLESFGGAAPHGCPAPRNLGFAAGPILLLSHLKYLRATKNRDGLADAVAEWLLSGSSARMGVGSDWFTPESARKRRRSALAWTSWGLALAMLLVIGGAIYPIAGSVAHEGACAAAQHIKFMRLPWLDGSKPAYSCSPAPEPPGARR